MMSHSVGRGDGTAQSCYYVTIHDLTRFMYGKEESRFTSMEALYAHPLPFLYNRHVLNYDPIRVQHFSDAWERCG